MSEEKIVVGDKEVSLAPPKKKKKWLKTVVVLLLLLGVIGIFVFGLLGAMNEDGSGNDLLFISGLIEVIIAVLGVKILLDREKKICPECGAKRVHHRRLIRTTEQYKNNTECAKIIYTHEYQDTWVCPDCGETMSEKVKKNGGELAEFNNGRIQDTRRAPNEF